MGRQEVQELLGACAKEAPKLVEDTVPTAPSPWASWCASCAGCCARGSRCAICRTILEAVADAAPRSKDTHFLVEQVRRRMARQITGRVADNGVVYALTLDRPAEDTLRHSLGHNEGEPVLAPDVEVARRLIASVETRAAALAAAGRSAVMLAPPDLRRPVFDFFSRFVPDLFVVSARELAPGTTIEPAGTVSLS